MLRLALLLPRKGPGLLLIFLLTFGLGARAGSPEYEYCIDLFAEIDSVETSLYEALPSVDVRIWYLRTIQRERVQHQNSAWARRGGSLRQRARLTWQIRHEARIKARNLMKDREERRRLEARDLEKYGNPHGPTFQWLLERLKSRGLTDDEA
jgi:hypothetical protein